MNGALVVNPTFDQILESTIDLIVAGTEKGITMVEGGAHQVPESLIVEAIEKAHVTIRELCRIQNELARLAGKTKLPLDREALHVHPRRRGAEVGVCQARARPASSRAKKRASRP